LAVEQNYRKFQKKSLDMGRAFDLSRLKGFLFGRVNPRGNFANTRKHPKL
jgi:hypothetical protein